MSNEYNHSVFIDGSYSQNGFGYSVILIGPYKVDYVEYGRVPAPFRSYKNVGCEFYAALRALQCIKELNSDKLSRIYYDYEGITRFIYEWDSKSEVMQGYKKRATQLINEINFDLYWLKVKSHSRIVYNDLADDYARMGTMCSKRMPCIKPYGELRKGH